MPYTSDTELARIATGLIDKTLPKPEWTHAAHFAAAIWFLSADPRGTFASMPDVIRSYNEATGVANTTDSGYHETITIASLRAALEALRSSPADQPLFETLNSLLASPLGQSDWLFAHWSRERLFSPEARRSWVEPDLRPLPFAEAP